MNTELISKCGKLMVLNNTNITVLDNTTGEIDIFTHFSAPKFLEERCMKNIEKVSRKYSTAKEDRVILYTDELKMCYLFFFVTSADSLVSTGPFLSEKIKKDEIMYLAHSMHLSIDNIAIFENYYSKLPLYSDDEIKDISFVITNLLSVTCFTPGIISDIKRGNLPNKNEYSNKFIQYDFVEQNYERESEILKAIENGDTDGLQILSNLSYEQVNIPSRNKYDPLRDAKNLTITLNSVSTRAAIRGGLNVHLAHSISTKYAIEIEGQKTVEDVFHLTGKLVREYAQAVRDYSLSKYTPLVKEALIIIRKNITQQISLNEISETLNTSKEHLSRVFKKEIGKNITDYINELKIKESLILIKSKKYSISQIAYMFGFSSSSYYSTVFKKVMGVSPKLHLLSYPKPK